MKCVLLPIVVSIIIAFTWGPVKNMINRNQTDDLNTSIFDEKDTCIIEGLAFMMVDYKSTRIMRATIKNSQIYIVSEGLQFAKYRIIQYVFSSLTNEQMPTFRYFNQRISPPILKILKKARVGEQYLFEDIVVVDGSNKILTNEVRPLMIERVQN